MRLELAPRRRRTTISLTPLIDVVFILLLFFLVASQLTPLHALGFNSPETLISQDATSKPPAVVVRAHADGRLALDGTPLRAAELRQALEARRARQPNLAVLLEADPALALQALVRTMDLITASGVRELNLR